MSSKVTKQIEVKAAGGGGAEKRELKKEHDQTDTCCICMDTLNPGKNFAKTNCQHAFCLTCLVRALKDNNTCPICRANIEEEKPIKTKALTLMQGAEIASEELDMFPVSDHLDAIRLFDNPGSSLKSMLRVFSLGLIKSIITFQENGEEWEVDEEESDDETEAAW